MPRKILIVEDELSIQSVLKELLTDAGYDATAACDGEEGVRLFRQGGFDLVLLDIMLPGLDGYDVCRAIRSMGNTPVIMLTALDEEEAQVRSFEMQVDDYITKPFSLKLVLLRVEAVLRRAAQSTADSGDAVLRFHNVRLDPQSRDVSVDGSPVALTPLEYDLLYLLMKHPKRAFTRENLLNMVWGYHYIGDEKAVNIHIMNLRRKLGGDLIETVRGVGYRLAKD